MNTTIVVVTHDLDSTFRIADRITVLDQGNILMTGSVEEIRASGNPRIQGLLNRQVREVQVDADEYLRRLTGQSASTDASP
jgi:phospholipid/cholesterol/gamma-HCH transport system ATP-binding protein